MLPFQVASAASYCNSSLYVSLMMMSKGHFSVKVTMVEGKVLKYITMSQLCNLKEKWL